MITTEYQIAYGEVLEILKYVSIIDRSKIPTNMINMFKKNAIRDNNFTYNPNKTLEEQNISKIARTIIAILYRDYWEDSRDFNNTKKDNQQMIEYKESIFRKMINKIKRYFIKNKDK